MGSRCGCRAFTVAVLVLALGHVYYAFEQQPQAARTLDADVGDLRQPFQGRSSGGMVSRVGGLGSPRPKPNGAFGGGLNILLPVFSYLVYLLSFSSSVR